MKKWVAMLLEFIIAAILVAASTQYLHLEDMLGRSCGYAFLATAGFCIFLAGAIWEK